MAGPAGPKRLDRAFAYYAAGAAVTQADLPAPADWSLFREVVFLARHGAWTWQILQDTPDDVVAMTRRLDLAMATEAARQRSS
jgi:hypothetical protein